MIARNSWTESCVVGLPVVLFLAMLAGVIWSSPTLAQETESDFVEGEVVVKLDLGQLGPSPDCAATIAEINSSNNTRVKEPLLQNPDVACIYLLQTTMPGADTQAVAQAIATDVRVKYAEPNFLTYPPEGNPRARAHSEYDPEPSDDPAPYASQYAVGAMRLTCAQSVNKGGGATVAVLDTGIQENHPELAGSLVPGYDFTEDDSNPDDAGNGVDDDGDTFTDEMTGHGTHVAGVVHLTAPEAKIMPLRVLDSDGTGNAFLVAEAVQYAVKNGADVINLSLGSSRKSNLLEDVIDDLDTDDDDDDTGPAIQGVPPEGVVAVASAGNENVEAERYPAAEVSAIAVASLGSDSVKSGFSNYGGWVDVAAPGDDIHSLFPTSRYAQWDGTSMAAPFVAGEAALLRGLEPTMGATLVGTTIADSARDVNSEPGNQNQPHSGKLGKGHADAFAAVQRLRPNATCNTAQPSPNTAPSITVVRPVPGSRTRDRTPTVSATVRDAQTNLAKSNVLLYVDGRRKTTFSYNTATDRLSYASPRLSYARHTVRIVARDPQGLVGSRIWRFNVAR